MASCSLSLRDPRTALGVVPRHLVLQRTRGTMIGIQNGPSLRALVSHCWVSLLRAALLDLIRTLIWDCFFKKPVYRGSLIACWK